MEGARGHSYVGRLAAALALNAVIVAAEALAGLVTGSTMLLGDAVHNLGDVAGLFISYVAARLASRGPSARYTFGMERVEVLAAYTNALLVLVFSALVAAEALMRLWSPEPIDAGLVASVAAVALAVNAASALILHTHSRESMNVRSAYLHLLGDALVSLVVIVGAAMVAATGLYIVDPVATIGIAVYVSWEALRLLREAAEILLEAAPLSLEEARRVIESVPGVRNAHHCHAWRLGEKSIHLECHVEVDDMPLSRAEKLLDDIEEKLRHLGVTHATIQLETGRCPEKSLLCKQRDHGGKHAER